MKPTRAGLSIDLSAAELDAIDPRWRSTVEQLCELVRRDLGYWEDFPIELPSTAFDQDSRLRPLGELFQVPSDDELDQVARDPSGKLKRLAPAQLTQLRNSGKFTVPSERYPGQQHVWELSALLQRGKVPILTSLRAGTAAALRQLVILVPRRLRGAGPVSVVRGAKNVMTGLRGVLDLLVGLPSMARRYSEWEVTERLRFARRDFVLEGFEAERADTAASESQQVPRKVVWNHGDGRRVDLSIQDPWVLDQASARLDDLFASSEVAWRREAVERQRAHLDALQAENLRPDELAARLSLELSREQLAGFFRLVLDDPAFSSIRPSLGALLVNYARARLTLHELELSNAATRDRERQQIIDRISRERPTLSLIAEWLDARLESDLSPILKAQEDELPRQALAALRERAIEQEELLFTRSLSFRTEHEPRLRKSLEGEEKSARTFNWARHIWSPKRWKIVRHEPTIPEGSVYPTRPAWYSAEPSVTTVVTTDGSFWRIRNAVVRAFTFLLNGLYWLIVENLWSGPIGLRALFVSQAFAARTEVDRRNGALVPSKATVPTYRFRIQRLWADVFESRRAFEAKPDTGFVGKSFTRWLSRIWNYLLKGAVGTTLIVVLQPIFTALNLAITLMLLVTSVLWAPLASFALWLGNILWVDTAVCPPGRRTLPLLGYLLVDVILAGVVQIASAVVLALVVHPAVSLVIGAYAGLGALLRTLYDTLLYALVIRRMGRVPASSGFLARRIEGPGMSSDFYFQIHTDLVMLVLRATLEKEELRLYEAKTEANIRAPERELERLTEQTFGHFVKASAPSERFATVVRQSTERHLKALQTALEPRRKLLTAITRFDDPRRIRQTRSELDTTLTLAAELVREHYTERWCPHLTELERDMLWADHGLTRGDFLGLARRWIAIAFSPGLLEPLEESDRSLRLQVEHIQIRDYLRALEQGDPLGDDLDRVRAQDRPSPPVLELTPPLNPRELFDANPSGLAALLRVTTDGVPPYDSESS